MGWNYIAILMLVSSTAFAQVVNQDAKAVVDPSSMKVHGLEGLRIADASVIPRMISGNLQTPTIMLAERAAQMILADS